MEFSGRVFDQKGAIAVTTNGSLADSSKSSSSERFAHPDGFRMDTCYSQQAVQGELQLWVMQEEHPHPALYSPGVPSASLDEYYPELSMGIQSGSAWHEVRAYLLHPSLSCCQKCVPCQLHCIRTRIHQHYA